MDFIPSSDPMKGWKQKYHNNPLKATESNEWKTQPSSQMFKKLFSYIQGANSMAHVMNMTTPVTIKHTPKESDLEEQKMCFWLGISWQRKQVPQPLEKYAEDIKVVKKDAIKVTNTFNFPFYKIFLI